MILAAADCADGKAPPPEELELALQCRQWHCLPEAGGIRDQRAGEMERMKIAINVYDAMQVYNDVGGKDVGKWIENHKNGAWKIVKMVQKLRKDIHGEI